MLCDTNILSELARPRPNAGVLAWAQTQSRLLISSVTVDELFFGLTWKPQPKIRQWFEGFLETRCEVFAVTPQVAQLGGEMRGQLYAKGRVRSQADMWIAATARIRDLVLVTRNTKDFEGCGVQLLDPFK